MNADIAMRTLSNSPNSHSYKIEHGQARQGDGRSLLSTHRRVVPPKKATDAHLDQKIKIKRKEEAASTRERRRRYFEKNRVDSYTPKSIKQRIFSHERIKHKKERRQAIEDAEVKRRVPNAYEKLQRIKRA